MPINKLNISIAIDIFISREKVIYRHNIIDAINHDISVTSFLCDLAQRGRSWCFAVLNPAHDETFTVPRFGIDAQKLARPGIFNNRDGAVAFFGQPISAWRYVANAEKVGEFYFFAFDCGLDVFHFIFLDLLKVAM
jgi:hypothetical protein